jgi:hypothetical protein
MISPGEGFLVTKAELYYEFLKEEGYVPHYDSDGDIVFKAEGLSYLLFAAEDDPAYFRLALPFFWEIESPAERQRVLAAAAVVNAEVKVVKLYVVEDHAWASVEMLVDPPENFKLVFPRCLRLLRHGVQRFSEIMNTPVQ